MSFTANGNFTTSSAASVITLSMAGTVAVTAGDVVFVYAGNDASQAISKIDDSLGHSATLLSLGSNGTRRHVIGYWLSAPSGGSITYGVTFAAAATDRTLGAWSFTPTAAASLDGATSGPATGNSTTVLSNALTTTGSDCLIWGACFSVGAGFSAPLIGGAAATASDSDGQGAMWYKATTGTGAKAQITVATGLWICDEMSVQIASGATGHGPLLSFKRNALMVG